MCVLPHFVALCPVLLYERRTSLKIQVGKLIRQIQESGDCDREVKNRVGLLCLGGREGGREGGRDGRTERGREGGRGGREGGEGARGGRDGRTDGKS